jgi:HSP20 family protein
MDDLFGRFFGESLPDNAGTGTYWPAMDVAENEDAVIVKAELPGTKPDDIEISVQGNTLTISGEKKEESEDRREGYYHTERRYGRFQRVVSLPNDVDPEKIEATHREGVLTVSLPKTEAAKPKRVKISAK